MDKNSIETDKLSRDQAKQIADEVNNRTQTQIIEQLILKAANEGKYFATTGEYESVEASNLKDYFKNQGFLVKKIKTVEGDRFGPVRTVYALQIWFN